MKKIPILLLAICSNVFFICSSSAQVRNGFSKRDVSNITKENKVYVFYYINNTAKEDGSYNYNPTGRKIIEELFKQKGYDIIFTRYRKKKVYYIQLNESRGTTSRSYKSEKVVGTYKDASGRVIGTYNEPTTRTTTRYSSRIDLYVFDPDYTSAYVDSDRTIYHYGKYKTGGKYSSRIKKILKNVINKLPSRK